MNEDQIVKLVVQLAADFRHFEQVNRKLTERYGKNGDGRLEHLSSVKEGGMRFAAGATEDTLSQMVDMSREELRELVDAEVVARWPASRLPGDPVTDDDQEV